MKLKQLKIQNFRCYKDEATIDLDDLVVLVGRNDAGKSTLFDALGIFFEDKATPDREDHCVHSDDASVRITCVFSDIPSQIVIDAQHITDLASERLLNGECLLEISKIYDCSLVRPKLSKVVAKAIHPTADKYNDLLLLNNSTLKQRAKELGVDLSDVNQSVNSELRQAIWSYADDLQEQLSDIEIKADADKIWAQLKKSLPVYALFRADRPSTDQDAEAQDPMKAAVKEAIQAQKDTLEQVAARVKEEVQEIANRTVEKIKEMNPELANELTPRVSTKNWDTLFSVNLTGDEDIPINKRGSGTRRLVLLNFFRAKAESEAAGSETGLIYAIEEPETSQHPHNQVMLVKALEDLVEMPECQVFVSTHTPVLARRFNQNALRLVSRTGEQPTVQHGRDEGTIKEIVESLGVLPDHNVKAFFGIEGKNDINFLSIISKMLHEANEDIPDLGKEEDNGRLVFVPLGGSNMVLWTSRLEEFNRPEFYLMDRDNPEPQKPKYHEFAQDVANRDNCTSWTTKRKELENYIHPDVIRPSYPNYKGNGSDFEDVPELFAQAVHEASQSPDSWDDVKKDEEKLGKKISNAKKRLNDEFASKMTPCLLSLIDTEGEVRSWLKQVGEALK